MKYAVRLYRRGARKPDAQTIVMSDDAFDTARALALDYQGKGYSISGNPMSGYDLYAPGAPNNAYPVYNILIETVTA